MTDPRYTTDASVDRLSALYAALLAVYNVAAKGADVELTDGTGNLLPLVARRLAAAQAERAFGPDPWATP